MDHGSVLSCKPQRLRDDHVLGERPAADDDRTVRRCGVDRGLDSRVSRRVAVAIGGAGLALRRDVQRPPFAMPVVAMVTGTGGEGSAGAYAGHEDESQEQGAVAKVARTNLHELPP